MTCPKVQTILTDILGAAQGQIAPGTTLSRKNGVDAIALAKLVMRCERAFQITIRDEDVLELARVADLADYIDARVEEGRDGYNLPSDQSREAWYYE